MKAPNPTSRVAVPTSSLPSPKISRIVDSMAALGPSQLYSDHSDISLTCS